MEFLTQPFFIWWSIENQYEILRIQNYLLLWLEVWLYDHQRKV